MKKQSTQQWPDMFSMAPGGMPDMTLLMGGDGAAKSQEVLENFTAVAKLQAKSAEKMMLATQAGTRSVGDKMMANMSVNTEAMFDAAQTISAAKTLPEAARLQADFVQQQTAVFAAQTQELMQLSANVFQQTFETMNEASAKSMKKMQKAGLSPK